MIYSRMVVETHIEKCPFCKSPASPNSQTPKCWVDCDTCGAQGPKITYGREEIAIALWNEWVQNQPKFYTHQNRMNARKLAEGSGVSGDLLDYILAGLDKFNSN